MSWLKKKVKVIRSIKISQVRGTQEQPLMIFYINPQNLKTGELNAGIRINPEMDLLIEPTIEEVEVPFWED